MSDESGTAEVQYAIGVDLGTTHCAIAYVDLDLSEGEEVAQHILPIPQVVAPGEIEALPLLPSFLYLPHESELDKSDLSLPWKAEPSDVTGELARRLGATTPIRLVSSAKSWLSHSGVDRRSALLPPAAPDDVAKLSPVDASLRYLEHLASAWDAKHPEAPFESQEVTLTVPASFDPSARELTAEAAARAGYTKLTLLEEPQAALYSWIERTGGEWRERVEVDDVILVIDVGGGTTDFSLISVKERDGALELSRVAVGDHILLGGDNMDLTLAHVVRAKLEAEGHSLDEWQMRALVHGCRGAKEVLLSRDDVESAPIVVPSRGSKLVAGSLRTELTRQEVTKVIVDGFFPEVESAARPQMRARGALTELGLPYAQDPGITRHLAAFLARQAGALGGAGERTFLHPTAVLFNGGVFKSRILAERVMSVLSTWLRAEDAREPRVLEGADLDLAVARGAAYYGYVRRGGGVRIRGGTAKSYYVGVEAAVPAVPGLEPPVQAHCVAPFGMEEGSEADPLPQELGLVVGEPVRFRFFESSVRRDDTVGTVVERWTRDEMEELAAIEATLPAEGKSPGEVVPVRLRAAVTEVGTLRLEAMPRTGDQRWKVELDTRGE